MFKRNRLPTLDLSVFGLQFGIFLGIVQWSCAFYMTSNMKRKSKINRKIVQFERKLVKRQAKCAATKTESHASLFKRNGIEAHAIVHGYISFLLLLLVLVSKNNGCVYVNHFVFFFYCAFMVEVIWLLPWSAMKCPPSLLHNVSHLHFVRSCAAHKFFPNRSDSEFIALIASSALCAHKVSALSMRCQTMDVAVHFQVRLLPDRWNPTVRRTYSTIQFIQVTGVDGTAAASARCRLRSKLKYLPITREKAEERIGHIRILYNDKSRWTYTKRIIVHIKCIFCPSISIDLDGSMAERRAVRCQRAALTQYWFVRLCCWCVGLNCTARDV